MRDPIFEQNQRAAAIDALRTMKAIILTILLVFAGAAHGLEIIASMKNVHGGYVYLTSVPCKEYDDDAFVALGTAETGEVLARACWSMVDDAIVLMAPWGEMFIYPVSDFRPREFH